MRKSSLSNHNANTLERRSRGRSTDGPRNSLLQPGFATKHRRSSSAENCGSGVGLLSRNSHVPIRRSRSQIQPAVTPRRETISPCPSRTTPNDGRRHSSKAALGTAQKPRRDVRNFTDKGVLNAAILRISNYFNKHGMVLNLRQPLTLKKFLDSTVFLLTELGMTDLGTPVNLTTGNYIEEIPFRMKLINYPGSLASSWLKTAYAQHSLQHVVAMLSWLVDLVELPTTVPFQDSNDEGFRILPAKHYFEFFSSAHMKWNSFQSEEEVIQDFKNKLAQTYMPSFDEDIKNDLRVEIASLAAKCQPESEISENKRELEETLQLLLSDIAKLKLHVKNTKKFCTTLDAKIQALDTKKGETEGKVVNIQCLTAKLRKQVASQEMSIDDLNELLQSCEHLRGRIRSGEKCISDLKEMAFKTDQHIVQTRAKFNKKMEHFNNLLVMESCSIPQLSQLQIRSNVLAKTYKEEANEVEKILFSLHKELVATRSEIHDVLLNIETQVDEVTLSVNSGRQEIARSKEQVCQLEDRISTFKTTMQENETKMREEVKNLQDEISKTLNNQEIVGLKEKLSVLSAKHEMWQIEVKKLKEKADRFFEESLGVTEIFIADVQKMRALKEERLRKIIEQKKNQRSKKREALQN